MLLMPDMFKETIDEKVAPQPTRDQAYLDRLQANLSIAEQSDGFGNVGVSSVNTFVSDRNASKRWRVNFDRSSFACCGRSTA